MRFPDPLVSGTLVRRYKRFLADVELATGQVVVAHCPNPGSMLSCDAAGSEVWLSPARNPERRLRYTWELIRVGGGLVGINTAHPNALVAEALATGAIAELDGYDGFRREVRYGRSSRIDFLLAGGGLAPCYVEVKNVTMRRGAKPDDAAEFPDAVTARGAKHLAELAAMAEAGSRAVMLYLVQREDSRRLTIAADVDPAYAGALERALAAGVEVIAYACRLSPEAIEVAQPVAVDLAPGGKGKAPARGGVKSPAGNAIIGP